MLRHRPDIRLGPSDVRQRPRGLRGGRTDAFGGARLLTALGFGWNRLRRRAMEPRGAEVRPLALLAVSIEEPASDSRAILQRDMLGAQRVSLQAKGLFSIHAGRPRGAFRRWDRADVQPPRRGRTQDLGGSGAEPERACRDR